MLREAKTDTAVVFGLHFRWMPAICGTVPLNQMLLWEQEAACSNHVAPTTEKTGFATTRSFFVRKSLRNTRFWALLTGQNFVKAVPMSGQFFGHQMGVNRQRCCRVLVPQGLSTTVIGVPWRPL